MGWPSRAILRVTIPPGTSSTSGLGTSAKVASIRRCKRALSSSRGPASAAHNTTSAPGKLVKTWYGPMKSRAVKPGYSRMEICMKKSSSSGSPPAEVLAVAVRGRADAALESAVQGLGMPEPDGDGHRVNGQVGGLEQAAGRLDPKRLDQSRRGSADLATKSAGEVARAHAGPLGQPVDSEILGQVAGQPSLERDDGGRAGRVTGPSAPAQRPSSRGPPAPHQPPRPSAIRTGARA